MCFLYSLHSVTACRQSVRRVFDLGRVVANYAVLVADVGVASQWSVVTEIGVLTVSLIYNAVDLVCPVSS